MEKQKQNNQEVEKIQYFENVLNKKQKDYVEANNNCILCSTVLELQYVSHDEDQVITETAYCSECELKTRSKKHLKM